MGREILLGSCFGLSRLGFPIIGRLACAEFVLFPRGASFFLFAFRSFFFFVF